MRPIAIDTWQQCNFKCSIATPSQDKDQLLLLSTMAHACIDTENPPGPLLIFVLGAPCSGKSTLCTALSTRYNIDHFSIGNEMRSLISASPSGPAARINSKFSELELEIFTKSVRARTLGPAHQTTKYVKERIFPEDMDVKDVRVLIDGFPRHVDRWSIFKSSVEDVWRPDQRTIAIIIGVGQEAALDRFIGRGRDGDVFQRRFDDYAEAIGDIVGSMQEDGVTVFELLSNDGVDAETIIRKLENSEAWVKAVGMSVSMEEAGNT